MANTSFDHVNLMLQKIIRLRKNMSQCVDYLYVPTSELTSINPEVSENANLYIPQIEALLKDLEASKQYSALVAKLEKEIQIATMIQRKKDCPISKIVDEI